MSEECPRFDKISKTLMTDSLSDSPTWIQEMLAHLKTSLYIMLDENKRNFDTSDMMKEISPCFHELNWFLFLVQIPETPHSEFFIRIAKSFTHYFVKLKPEFLYISI